MRPGEGITGAAAAERAPVMIPRRRTSTRASSCSRTCPRTSTSRSSPCRSSPADKLEGALNVRTREPREFTEAEIELLVAIASQVAQTIEHAKLYAEAQRRVAELEALARISEAVSESLYLEESLEAIVKTTMESLHATGAALVLEDGKIAWPEGRAGRVRRAPAAALEAAADRRARLRPRHAVHRGRPRRCSRRSPTTRRSRSSTGARCMRGVLAQEIHHRVKNNLQTVASLLRLQARAEDVDPRKALARLRQPDPRHRRGARGADRAPRGRRRPRRARRPAARDARPGPRRREGRDAELEPVSLAGQQATALALVFTELFQNALEHGGAHVSIELAQRDGEVVLAIADDGAGIDGDGRRAPGSRSCARSSATSSAASSSSRTTAGCAPRWCSRR